MQTKSIKGWSNCTKIRYNSNQDKAVYQTQRETFHIDKWATYEEDIVINNMDV